MPGLTGFIPGERGSREMPRRVQRAVQAQMAEPGYGMELHELPAGGAVAAVDSGLDCRLVRIDAETAPACVVAWFGRPALGSAGVDSREIARRIADSFMAGNPDFVRNISGSFVLFVHDATTGRTMIAVDHCASRPVFFAFADGALCFAPEPGALLHLLPDPPTVLPVAVASFTVNGHLLADDTFFDGMKPLLPGQYLLFENGRLRVGYHWRYVIEPSDADRGEPHYVDALVDLLANATGHALNGAGHPILPLSGGYDSRGILGFMLEQLPREDIRTVSWGVDEQMEGSDAFLGRRLAEHVGVEHHFMRRDAHRLLDDIGPMISRSQGLTDDPCFHHGELRIMQALRYDLGATSLLRGDECFGFGGEASSDTEALRRIAISPWASLPSLHRLLRAEVRSDVIESYGNRLAGILDSCPAGDPLDRKDWCYFTQRLTHYLNRSTYYKQTVIEVFNPWLDRSILEFIAGVPRRYRVDKILYRKALERRFPELFSIPFASRHSLEDWTAVVRADKSLQSFLRAHLVEDRNGLHEWFSAEEMSNLLDRISLPPQRRSMRTATGDAVRSALARWPAAYRLIKSLMIDRVPAPAPPSAVVLLRLLQLKLWFDEFAPNRV